MQITNDIHWTGYIDWNLRNFHGYITPTGSTYNAYLIIDKEPTLIDTVKHYGFDEMLERIKAVIDPAKIRYIISNHTEMDHSGTIDKLLEYCPDAQVVCSPKGAEGLRRHFKKDWNFKIVNTGDVLDIGKRKLQFFLMPMVHWPDSMATYSESDRMLFSNDAFGQHYASFERYVDEVGFDIAQKEATRYYANIVMPYGGQVLKALEALRALKIDMICPSHGLVWRTQEHIKSIVQLYQQWANHETKKQVVIAYDTMWHSTEAMAIRLHEELEKLEIPVTLLDLKCTDISEITTHVLVSKVVAFGSPILNNRMLPTMAALLMYLKGLKPKNRLALTFGSYGWSTAGFKELEESVKDAEFELIDQGHYIKFVPDEGELVQFSTTMARTIKEKLA